MDHLDLPTSDPILISRSFPPRTRELDHPVKSTNSDNTDEDWPWDENEDQENHWLLNGDHNSHHYGSSLPSTSEMTRKMHSKKRKRESGGPSLTKLATKVKHSSLVSQHSDM